MHRFKDLEIWTQSRISCKEIYGLTADFPDSEKFGLSSQLRRASVSIPSNIAEGASRKSNKDFSRFLEITLGSCYEIETQLLISNDLGFLNDDTMKQSLSKLESIVRMMSKFKSTLK